MISLVASVLIYFPWCWIGSAGRFSGAGFFGEGFGIITDHFPKLWVCHTMPTVQSIGGLHLSCEFRWKQSLLGVCPVFEGCRENMLV